MNEPNLERECRSLFNKWWSIRNKNKSPNDVNLTKENYNDCKVAWMKGFKHGFLRSIELKDFCDFMDKQKPSLEEQLEEVLRVSKMTMSELSGQDEINPPPSAPSSATKG